MKTNQLFEKCLANVNPETRAEVRRNMEAIEILSVLRSLYEGNVGDKELKTHEAFSLAIEALKICPKE